MERYYKRSSAINKVIYAGAIMVLAAGCSKMQMKTVQPEYEASARKVVNQMTLDEKIAQLHGIRNKSEYRVVPGVSRLNIPAFPITNGPAGVGPGGPGHEGKATALPAPISLAATWDIAAARLNGEVAGSEAAALGNILLESPDVNIARTPCNGRTFEGFGEDPYLTSQIAVANIQGIQSQGIMANVKHYAGNNQEKNRHKVNAIIDERVLREIYLPAFEASVKEGHVASLMSAYNKLNGAYCSENDFLLNQVLRKDWGFNGFVLSDFGAVNSTVPSAKNGLDLEMPTGIYFGDSLKKAVQSGIIPVSLLDKKLVNRYSTMMQFGVWDKQPLQKNIPPENAEKAMKLGAEGIVLLQNKGGQLPLNSESIHSIALIGPFAGKAMTGGGGSSHVNPLLSVSPAEGIRKIVGENILVKENNGKNISTAVSIAKASDVVILLLGDHQSEGSDHSISLNGNQDSLAFAVLAANPHTIVVLKSGGPVLMPWVNKAPAILEAWYPGEEDGDAVASVLFGKINPSGKLPITFPKKMDDLPIQTADQYPGIDYVQHYTEGLLVGYRWYDTKNIEPLFPFGYGLSYTTFSYNDLKVSFPDKKKGVVVEFNVTNTGNREGAEVAQVYVSLPSNPEIPQPLRQLKGFKRVELAPGQSAHISIPLDVRALSYWNQSSHSWKVLPGNYTVYAAASSRDLRLTGTFTLK